MNQTEIEILISELNAPKSIDRLTALKKLRAEVDKGIIPKPVRLKDVNSHIHTIYSFSPYSPSAAVFKSWQSGLVTTGIMDHDSISGAVEFTEAGRIMNMPTTIGAELRASFAGTKLEGKRINNPDQETVAYVAMHGIPHSAIPALTEFFKPISVERGKRNRLMVKKINTLLKDTGVEIDYDIDVIPLSMSYNYGSITERHLLFAVARKMIAKFGKGDKIIDVLESKLQIPVKGANIKYLSDASNEMYDYDLLNVLKGNMVEQFYIPSTLEAYPIAKVSEFAKEHGIILAYAYLGDVTESVTGDKKAQKFEDDFLDDLFETIKELEFKSFTYMPSRNTPEQLERLRMLCDKYQFFQISGEDINQPRQKFVCEAMRKPEFDNLYDAAWALIGHEWLATKDLALGMFSDETIERLPSLSDRITEFRDYALATFG